MMKQVLCIFLLLSILSGCSEPVHDVQYYMDFPEEMKKKVKSCVYDTEKSRNDQNCINAFEAESKSMFRSKKMPKIK